MADISVTAANVAKGSNAQTEVGIAGAAITAGQVVYQDTADSNKFKLAQNDGTELEATVFGIALNSAPASGQPLSVQTVGNINVGGTLTVGEIYVVSSTAGGIAPEADNNAQNDYVTILGVATTSSNLKLQIINSSARIP